MSFQFKALKHSVLVILGIVIALMATIQAAEAHPNHDATGAISATQMLRIDLFEPGSASVLGSGVVSSAAGCVISAVNSSNAADYYAVDKATRDASAEWAQVRAGVESTVVWLPYLKFLGVAMILGGITMPLETARKYNRQFAGNQAASTYDAAIIEVTSSEWLGPVQEAVGELGYDIDLSERRMAESVGLVVVLVTLGFTLISLIIVGIAAVNIAHTFFMHSPPFLHLRNQMAPLVSLKPCLNRVIQLVPTLVELILR